MLDHLKKDRQVGLGAQERMRLSIYVAGLLLLGGVIVVGSLGDSKKAEDAREGAASAPVAPSETPGPLLDPGELQRRVAGSGDEPHRYASDGIEYVLDIGRRGRLGEVRGRLAPQALAALAPEVARGGVYEVAGRVTDRTREEYRPRADSTGDERLWSLVLEGPDASQVVVLKYGRRSDREEGAPVEAKPPNVRADLIEVGQHVLVRGVYLQQRTGTIGRTPLKEPTPVLLAQKFRIELPPEELLQPIPDLEEALWSDIRDRFNRDSRNWEEDALFEVVQWARAQGYEACRDAVLKGDVGWKAWGPETFAVWKKEVAVDEDDPRPFTEGARGKVFRLSGIVSEVLEDGWERMPRNPWGISEFQRLTLHSDDYRSVALRLILPFPIHTFKGVEGTFKEHLYVYGVFIKNYTYDTQFTREDGSGRPLPVTVPLFVVLHAELFPEGEAAEAMHRAMLWVAGVMVIFGVVFYLVLIRGGRKQVRRMEEHRMRLRRRARASMQGKDPAGEGPDAPEAAPEGEAPDG